MQAFFSKASSTPKASHTLVFRYRSSYAYEASAMLPLEELHSGGSSDVVISQRIV